MVPGISSSISVPAAVGIPVTHRGVAHEFTVVSGHVAPDDPRSLVDWEALARLRGTLVVLMGVERIADIARALVAAGRDPGTPVAVVQEGTTAAQRRVDATLATVGRTVKDEGVRPPAVIVIGDVVAVGAAVAGTAAKAARAAEAGSDASGAEDAHDIDGVRDGRAARRG